MYEKSLESLPGPEPPDEYKGTILLINYEMFTF